MGSSIHRTLILWLGVVLLAGSAAVLAVSDGPAWRPVVPELWSRSTPETLSETASAGHRRWQRVQDVVQLTVAPVVSSAWLVAGAIAGGGLLATSVVVVHARRRQCMPSTAAAARGGPHRAVPTDMARIEQPPRPARIDWRSAEHAYARVATVSAALQQAIAAGVWHSPLALLATEDGTAYSEITINMLWHPDDHGQEAHLSRYVAREHPGLTAEWHGQQLRIHMASDGAPLAAATVVLPVLASSTASGVRLHYVALESVRHLAIVGPDGEAVLHRLLLDTLAMSSPRRLALSVVGDDSIAQVYRAAPHWVVPPIDPVDALHRLCEPPTASTADSPTAAVLLVIVEPAPPLRDALLAYARARHPSVTPALHILVMSTRDDALVPDLPSLSLLAPSTAGRGRARHEHDSAPAVVRVGELAVSGLAPRSDRASARRFLEMLHGGNTPPISVPWASQARHL